MSYKLDFVKAHAGWDECIFLLGDQLPAGKELDVSLSLLKKPSIGGTEVGILYPPTDSGDIKVKIVDSTSQGFIKMCGGLTQSLGKALVETKLGDYLGIELENGTEQLLLETDAGLIPIRIEIEGETATKVVTNMNSYLKDCYKRGVEFVNIEGMKLVNVGVTKAVREFLVVNLDEHENYFSGLNVWKREHPVLEKLKNLYCKFLRTKNLSREFLYGVVYKINPSETITKDVRTVFRFFPWQRDPDDPEFACGTGTVALGIAMFELEQLDFTDELEKIVITVGGKHVPERQQATTTLTIKGSNKKITDMWFSHDRIEILAYGKAVIN